MGMWILPKMERIHIASFFRSTKRICPPKRVGKTRYFVILGIGEGRGGYPRSSQQDPLPVQPSEKHGLPPSDLGTEKGGRPERTLTAVLVAFHWDMNFLGQLVERASQGGRVDLSTKKIPSTSQNSPGKWVKIGATFPQRHVNIRGENDCWHPWAIAQPS